MAFRPVPPGGLPHLSFEARRPSALAPLRTDIALFIGSAPKGPVGVPVRVEGWRTYEKEFGGLHDVTNMGHALRGYFENAGQIAWIIRVAPGAVAATSDWRPADGSNPSLAALAVDRFRFTAKSPGCWGEALGITPSYRPDSAGIPVVDLDIRLDGRLVEQMRNIAPDRLAEMVNARSEYIQMAPAAGAGALLAAPVPRSWTWPEIRLDNGTDGAPPGRSDYARVLPGAAELSEPALLAMPDLHQHLSEADAAAVLLGAARIADPLLDRLIVADAPEHVETTAEADAWITLFGNDPIIRRCLTTYHPWIEMRDPIGTLAAPVRRLPPSGHVAGVISRLDRERGAYTTPANASVSDAIDLARRISKADQDGFATRGLNALQCQSARGIVVWGGRMTQSDAAPTQFVAHRRLIHRLVRALRRTWEPMVFETNDMQLRLAIERSATALLSEAFHAGVLQGTTPNQAYRVTVDDTVNPPEAIAAGRVACEIGIAPAVPMEFIHFRVGLSADGSVEFVEL